MSKLLVTCFIFCLMLLSGCGSDGVTGSKTELSSNANLIDLSLSTGTLSPTFSAAITSYNISPTTSSTISLTATLADLNASFTINGNTGVSDILSEPISLNVGDNIITVDVTAEDTTVSKTYSINVNRLAGLSNNANLIDLTTSNGSLSPGFTEGNVNYTVNVDNAITTTTLTATTSDSSAALTINGNNEVSNVESADISLNVGANAIEVVVTAADSATITTYSVTIIRASLIASNINLSNLDITETSLDQAFMAGSTPYTASTEFLITSVQITPTSVDSNTVITVNNVLVASGTLSQPISLLEGINDIRVKLTSADSLTQNTYIITVTRETANSFAQNAYIKSNFQSTQTFGGSIGSSDPGRAIAINGNTLAVGVIFDEFVVTTTTYDSAVYIFVRNSGSWTFQQRIMYNLGGSFGFTVDLHNDTLVVGDNIAARGIAPNRVNSGAVHVYTRDVETWSLEQIIEPDTLVNSIRFGSSVAIYGDTLAIGAPLQPFTIGAFTTFAGAVYIYTRSGTIWTQQVILRPENLGFANSFGTNVALYNDILVATSPEESSSATGVNIIGSNIAGTNTGAVYTFKGAGAEWTQEAYIKSEVLPMNLFGGSISLYGNLLAVTSTFESKVFLYSNASGSWVKHSEVQPAIVPLLGNIFASSVSIYKNTLVVGAKSNGTGATGINSDQTLSGLATSGAAYIFAFNGSVWTEQAFIKASNPGTGHRFGSSVAIYKDIAAIWSGENSGAVGVNGDQGSLGLNIGAVYLFD